MKSIIATITAIICITILEIFAMSQGIDGVALAGACTIIAGLGGFQASKVVKKKPPEEKPPAPPAT